MNPLKLYLRDGKRSDLEEAIKKARQEVQRCAESRNLPEKANWLGSLSTCLIHRYELLRGQSDLDAAVDSLRQCTQLLSDAQKPRYLGALARALHLRGEDFPDCRSGDRHDELRALNEAYMLTEKYISKHDASYINRAAYLHDIGVTLLAQFLTTPTVRGIQGAVAAFNHAITKSPQPQEYFFALSIAQLYLFDFTDDVSAIDSAISNLRAISLIPHDAAVAYHLGLALRKRVDKLGCPDKSDLDESVKLSQLALDSTPPTDRTLRAMRSNSLGSSLLCRFIYCGGNQLEDAIRYMQDAVDLRDACTPADNSLFLHSLANALHKRFDHLHLSADIDKSISLLDEAHLIPGAKDLHNWQLLNDLSSSLQCRFHHTGQQADLDRVIALLRPLIALPFEGTAAQTTLGKCCSGLSIAHISRFVQNGDIDDIDHAITAATAAVKLLPETHSDSSHAFCILGAAYHIRFERHRKLPDINDAISNFQQSVDKTGDEHDMKPIYLRSLGNAFRSRYEHKKGRKPGDLEGAIKSFNDARAKMQHQDYILLESLGDAYQTRFERNSDEVQPTNSDIDEAIRWLHEAVRITPVDHFQRYTTLTSLGNSLHIRSTKAGGSLTRRSDLQKAAAYKEEAAALVPVGHAQRSALLANLGATLALLYQETKEADYVNRAIAAFRVAAHSETGQPVIRLHAAYRAAYLSFHHSEHPMSLDFYRLAMELIPKVIWLGANVKRRYDDLPKIDAIVSGAVAAAIFEKQFTTAVEWLEQGRGICWNQMLALRSPVEDLKDQHPNLRRDITELQLVSAALDKASTADDTPSTTSGCSSQNQRKSGSETDISKHHALARRYSEILERIRRKGGLEDFMKPAPFEKLIVAADRGPVVILFAHKDTGCNALMLRRGDRIPQLISLNISYSEITKMGIGFNERLQNLKHRGLKPPSNVSAKSHSHVRDIAVILRRLWEGVTDPILRSSKLYREPIAQDTSKLPHITWLPTGPFVYLPIHAAGIYSATPEPLPVYQTHHHVVSSYTTSLAALLDRCHLSPLKLASTRLLLISQRYSGTSHALPAVQNEIEALKRALPSPFSSTGIVHLEDEKATTDGVMAEMSNCAFMHIASHAMSSNVLSTDSRQPDTDPTHTAFLLSGDCKLTLERIMQRDIDHRQSPHRLAVLSACMTAAGSKQLPEESVHLAAGMMAAGYPSVVATMWAIQDADAPHFTENFYKQLAKRSTGMNGIDGRVVAYALHKAAEALRERISCDPDVSGWLMRWVPFVHFGV